ncbi:hypothetical protein ABMA27_010483 [Loxostege sticticalis]|uniref:Integrase catalytic domain-containing protein n=1 Tax=Loxostege sticticalis TaxID=481309 RepID=A0ABR3H648_LOXSC
MASRGVSPKVIQSCTLWWEGPDFLKDDETNWPTKIDLKQELDLPERRAPPKCENKSNIKTKTNLHANSNEHTTTKINLHVSTAKNAADRCGVINFERFSSFITLQRSVAYLLRFIHNLRNKTNKTGNLTLHELNSALKVLIKEHQLECFATERNILSQGKTLPANSPILSLSPFIDQGNILCVGGRLQNSQENVNKKHPVLLESRHHFAKLLFMHFHKKFLHCGPQALLSESINPKMGNLPSHRVTANLPFQVSGVDLAGPYYITDRKGRGCKISKCYMCLFVCFASKALHLEVVSDLSTDTFILSLRRFISRRGRPSHLYCDNGTNFVGANNELARFIRSSNEDISAFASNEGIDFKFSPAYSPHFGGIWESAVKSAKFHITRVLGTQHLTFEELSTLFTQVEAILNSRPITPLSTDPNDFEPLTPGHFLIGRALTSLPSPNFTNVNENRLRRYERLEQLRQHFWERWRNEYLCELQRRTKWKISQKQFQEGDLVVLKEENAPPLKWRLGRIQKLYPGPDGIVRVADVRTARGILRRAVHKLCCLPDPVENYSKTCSFEGREEVQDYSIDAQH